ncbi:transposase family protein, partial [Pseudonocardia asaccharolytica]|uniref:transposase family protein n=1 Tax=Pseudonocardia asaccharolytica TaxID=54010 RepID=UPI001649AA4D
MSDPVTYTGTLPLGEHTAVHLAQLLAGARRDRRTRTGRRALGPWRQAVLVLRWFLDGTRVAPLALDNQLSLSTAYRYLPEGIDVLAAAAPGLHGALLAAKLAGHTHVCPDGTLIRTDRSKAAGPGVSADGRAVDLWWSGKHHHHGGNVQVGTAPDGWPLWTSPVRPGREHDTTCARAHAELLPALDMWSDDEARVALADPGYQGENDRLVCPVKK